MYRVILLVLLGVLTSGSAWSARLEGIVKDEQGQPLPYINIIVLNHQLGSTTNEEGYYFLDLPYGTYDIQAFYMGYQTQTQKIELDQSIHELNFTMKTTTVKLKEIEIVAKDEDPGYEIMRLAYERKKQRIQNINTFQSDIYLKGTIDLIKMPTKIFGQELDTSDMEGLGLVDGKGILYVLEQKSTLYQEGDQMHHFIQHVKETGNDNSLGISNVIPIIDIYENRVPVLSLNPRGFISPLHPNAKNYYHFEYVGEFVDNGQTILKIKLLPRRKYEPVFQGYVYIYDNNYDIHSVELKLDHTSQIDLVNEITIDQSFRYLQQQRIIQRQDMRFIMSLFGVEFEGKFTNLYTHQQVNQPIDWPSFQRENIIASYDEQYNQFQSEEEWDQLRPIKLSAREQSALQSIQDHTEQLKKEEDSLMVSSRTTPFKVANLLLGGRLMKIDASILSTSGILSSANFNTVEGLNLSLDLHWAVPLPLQKKLNIYFRNRYGFINGHYDPSLNFNYSKLFPKNSRKELITHFKVGKSTSSINNNITAPEFFNTFTSLVQGINPLKLVRNNFIALGSNYHSGTGWSFSLLANFSHYQQLYNTTHYSFVPEEKIKYTSNTPLALEEYGFVDKSLTVTSSITFQPGWKYIAIGEQLNPIISKTPKFSVLYKKAIPINGLSTANYHFLEASIAQNLGLGSLGTLNYQISGHYMNARTQSVPWAEWKHFSTSEYWLKNDYTQPSFFMMPNYDYSSPNGWGNEIHMEWYMQGFLTNKIPFFKQLNWNGVVGYHHLLRPYYIGFSDLALEYGHQLYGELTFGLENIGFKIYRFFRVDAVMSFDEDFERKWGVRFGIQTSIFK